MRAGFAAGRCMLLLVGFILAVLVYVSVLAWLLAPLVCWRSAKWRKLRVAAGITLLVANVVTPLFFPIVWPVYAVSSGAGDFVMAVLLFPRTLPLYVRNILAWQRAPSLVIEAAYPIELSGRRYVPVVRIACAKRGVLLFDKFQSVPVASFTTSVGGGILARAGNDIIGLDDSQALCSTALHHPLKLGPFPGHRVWIGNGPRLSVVRGNAEAAQVYSLVFHGVPVAMDDITFEPPQVVSVEERPATETIPLDALWPMKTRREAGSYGSQPFIEAYNWLPASARPCVEFISPKTDFTTLQTVGRHTSRMEFRKRHNWVPPERRRAYCTSEFDKLIPPATIARLDPVAGG
jgi:hypothetical protein